MSDIAELVRRLRASDAHPLSIHGQTMTEAADALEAQAKEIAEKDDRISELENGWLDEAKKMCARIAELEVENAKLSVRCQAMFSFLPDEIKIGDIQKAVAALKGEK